MEDPSRLPFDYGALTSVSSTIHYLWAVPLLFFSMLCISSAALFFNFLEEAHPISKVAWRFQITFVIQLLLSIREWCTEPEAVKKMWR
jgi:hypothetical protein